MPDLSGLPLKIVEEDDDARDYVYDDGSMYIFMTVSEDGAAVLHDVALKGDAAADKRKGAGRAVMQRLRPCFTHIMAGGAGSHESYGKPTGGSYSGQPGFEFWRSMLREGLIDEIDIWGCGTRIVREMLSEPVTTLSGIVIEPHPSDMPSDSPGP